MVDFTTRKILINSRIGKILNKNEDFMSQIRNANFRTQVFDVGKEIGNLFYKIKNRCTN